MLASISGPAIIAFASSAAEVSQAILWARRGGVPMRVRSGRHSYEAYSLIDGGLVLDVSALDSVRVDAAAGTVRVGAGCTLESLNGTLDRSGVTVPAGSCGSLSIAGLALGGGCGLSSRLHGLTCDHLLSAEVVTADGRVVRASDSENADLFWALRGGGGGNFGVVTALELRLRAAPGVSTYYVRWPIADCPAVVDAWQRWAPYADPRLVSILGAGGEHAYSGGQFAGGADDLRKLLQPLLAAGTPGPVQLAARSSIEAIRWFSGEAVDVRPKFKNASAYAARALPDAAVQVVMRSLAGAPGPHNGIELFSMGGAIAGPGAADTAFAHRGALFSIQLQAWWSESADEEANRRWVKATREAIAPYTSGAYVNYVDGDQPDFARAYYGDNLERLRSVKRAHDPDTFFDFPQALSR